MTPSWLDETEEKAKAATPGPWVADAILEAWKHGSGNESESAIADAAYIAALSPERFLALAKVVKAARFWSYYKHAPADPRDDDLHDALARLDELEGG